MEIILPPAPALTDYGKTVIATEFAYTALVREAARLGLPLTPAMGLVYLSDEAVTARFQAACRDVLALLATPTPNQPAPSA